jgi:uncharacterized membrane protein
MAISIKPRPVTAAPTEWVWPSSQARISGFLVICVLCVGLLFRVSHLERKAYWGDEVYSSLRVLGFKTTEVVEAVATGAPILAADVQKYQRPAPGRGVTDTINVLVQEDAHLTPLYFVLGRIWVAWWGSSIVAMRSLSVLFSLLTLPACYWLSRELFDSVPIAWLTVLLNVISPIYLVYAQEARMYSLWSLTTILAMASLLRALHQNTWKSWAGFSLALTLQFYAHLFSLVMLLAYGLYVLGLRMGDASVSLRRFALAAGTALVAFLPWLWVFFHRSVQAPSEEVSEPSTILGTLKHLGGMFSRLFIDLNANSKTPLLELAFSLIVGVGCLGLVIYGISALYRETSPRAWLFILLILVAAPLGPLYAYHTLILSPRYLLPGYVGLQLIAAYVLGSRVFGRPGDRSSEYPSEYSSAYLSEYPSYHFNEVHSGNSSERSSNRFVGNFKNNLTHYFIGHFSQDVQPTALNPPQSIRTQQWAWSTALGLIVTCGILSCGQMVRSDVWWNKQYSNCNTKSAQLVNQSANPLVISDVNGGRFFDHPLSNVLSLSTALKPTVHLQIFARQTYPPIAVEFSDRFVITPSSTLRTHLQKNYGDRFQAVYVSSERYRGSSVCLWKLVN